MFRIRIHFLRIRIRIQWIRMEANTDPDTDPDPIRIQGFNDQKFKKITAEKKKFFIKNCNLPIPRPPQSMSRLQKKPPAHKTLQNMNFFYFCGSFLPSWIRMRIQWSDWIRIQSGSGSETLILGVSPAVETGITPWLPTGCLLPKSGNISSGPHNRTILLQTQA